MNFKQKSIFYPYFSNFFSNLYEKKNRLDKTAYTKTVIIMKQETYIKELIEFIKKGTTTYTTIKEIKKELERFDFKELEEENIWHLTTGKHYVTRNDASLICFTIGENSQNSFNIITTHSDTPAFRLKPQNESYENGYLKLNVSLYGGLLNYGWLDRPLSIAGKIITKEENRFESNIIDFKKPLLTIPSVAIHLNADANKNLDLNTQVDLIPFISLKEEKNIIKTLIEKEFSIKKEIICDYDLFLYNTEEPTSIGIEKDILLSPRIDNLTSTFAAWKAIIENKNSKNINVFCTFNSEEIGSLTKEGADSNFLLDTLKKIATSLKIDISSTLYQSFIISSDNTHAVHPNHPDLSDNTNKAYLNQGIVISKETESTTDALSSSIIKSICKSKKIPFQESTSRNDMSTGSTLAGISLRHVSTTSIDIGLAELAMHSSNECIGKKDCYDLYQMFQEFYNTSFQKKEKSTYINKS